MKTSPLWSNNKKHIYEVHVMKYSSPGFVDLVSTFILDLGNGC